MAFCVQCGKPIAEQAKFCSKCGARQNAGSVSVRNTAVQQHPPVTTGNDYAPVYGGGGGTPIFRVGANNGLITVNIICIIIIIFLAFSLWEYIGKEIKISQAMYEEHPSLYDKNKVDQILRNAEYQRRFYVLLDCVLIAITALKTYLVSKNHLILTHEGISGTATPLFGIGTLQVSEAYGSILSVKRILGGIKVKCVNKTYHFYINDPARACALLQQRIIHRTYQ